MKDIPRKFGILYISIFGKEVISGIKKEVMELFLQTEGSDDEDIYELIYNPIFVDENLLPRFLEPVSSLRKGNEGIFDGFDRNFDKANKVLFLYPNWAVLFEVMDLDQKKEDAYRDLFCLLEPNITNFLMTISHMVSSFLSNKYELTLRMYRHECTHIADTLNDNNEDVFRKNCKGDLPPSEGKDTCDDVETSISTINNMANIIGLIVGRINKENTALIEEEVSVFKEILYKWDKVFSYRVRERNLSILTPPVRHWDEMRPFTIRTNRQLFEMVVSNIIDNAVKYCHWGSNIYLDFKKFTKGSSSALVTVENYGQWIENSKKPYEMYFRTGQDKKIWLSVTG